MPIYGVNTAKSTLADTPALFTRHASCSQISPSLEGRPIGAKDTMQCSEGKLQLCEIRCTLMGMQWTTGYSHRTTSGTPPSFRRMIQFDLYECYHLDDLSSYVHLIYMCTCVCKSHVHTYVICRYLHILCILMRVYIYAYI
jgi:hypothetical protein